MSHFLEYCNSPIATRSIFALIQTLLSNGRSDESGANVASVYTAFELQRALITFRKYVEKYDLVQIRAFCGFLTNILKTGLCCLEK